MPHNKPNDNFVGVWVTNHPLRVYLVSVMVGPPLWDMGKVFKWHSWHKMHAQGRNVQPLIRTYNEHPILYVLFTKTRLQGM